MKFNFKKIASVIASTAMLGSTIAFAAAAAWPAPFVESGMAKGAVVYGANSATTDYSAALELAADLNSNVEAGTSTTIEGDSVQIQLTGDNLNYDDTFNEILSSGIDDSDLSTLLADGRFYDNDGDNDNDVTYTQVISFGTNAPNVTYAADDDGGEVAGSYLRLTDDAQIFSYVLEFDDSVEVANSTTTATVKADLDGVDLEVMGVQYQIVDATLNSAYNCLNKVVLMGGAVEATLQEKESTSLNLDGSTYDVTLDIVDSNGNAIFKVNGNPTDELGEGDTYEIATDIDIGVRTVTYQDYAGGIKQVEFYLGAEKLTLEEGKKVEKNDDKVDGSLVSFQCGTATSSVQKWNSLTINYTAKDDVYLGSETDGDTFVDPIFGSLAFKFGGVTTDMETMELKTSKNDATFTYTNKDGKDVEIPMYRDDTNNYVILGTDTDELLVTDGLVGGKAKYVKNAGATSSDDIENMMLLVVDSGENAHIIEIVDIEEGDDNQTDLSDLTYDKDYNDKDITINAWGTANGAGVGPADNWTSVTCNGTASSISLGSTGTIEVYFYNNGVICVDNGGLMLDGTAESENQARINVTDGQNYTWATANATVMIEENDEEGVQHKIYLNLTEDDGDDDRLEILTPTTNGAAWNSGFVDESDANDDDQYLVTEWGSMLKWDAEDKLIATLEHPAEQAVANAWVAEASASLSGGSAQVVVVTDSEVSSVSDKNLVVVGGSCINTVAAKMLGSDTPLCGEAFSAKTNVGAGQYIVKVAASPYNANKVAMLVAGYNAADTQNAVAKVKEGGMSTDVGMSQVYPMTA